MRVPILVALWGPLVAACGAGGDLGPGGLDGGGHGLADGTASCLSSNECPAGTFCGEFGVCVALPPGGNPDAGVTPPPEVEVELGEPISSERFVYVAMTAQNELARIDGATLAVTATAVGKSPRVVSAIPGSDGAVVLDSINGTATVVRPDSAGVGDTIRVLPTLHDLNRLDVDPTGRFAVVWFDLTKQIQDGGIGGVGSFQDVTVIALAPGHELAVDLTVGFRPRNVQFDAAGDRAYVVTQDGVSVIDMPYATGHGPSIVPPIAVADPAIPPEALEVEVEATGELAVVRQAGLAKVRIVNVGSTPGAVREIPLATPPTDIDLAPDGARAYAVQREAKLLSIIDLPGPGVTTIDLADAAIGSFVLSRDGHRALLFTNATLDERITMIRLDQPGFPHVTWPLKKAVRAVGISPTGATAIVLGAKAPGDPATATTVDDFIDQSYGYALLDLATGFSKLQITKVDPGPFTYAPDGSKAYVALDGGDAVLATRAVQIVTTQTGVVTTKTLGSSPSGVGILPAAGEAFVAQRHPLGRISFVDLGTDAMRTVTGFDLNSQIVN